MLRTKHFESCRAVFQGGGCRAAALAGAYQAAHDAGINFSAVAGTSAGSILAALVGAGASPTYILNSIKSIDFNQFLKAAKNGDSVASRLYRILSYLPIKSELRRFVRCGGAYSSEYLYSWVNKTMKELIPKDGAVQFSDLWIPTYIVATDLNTGRDKEFSTRKTPDADVSLAVQASCAIPFFFQPVSYGHTRLVDGGVLSNLPSYVFSGDSDFTDPILAFRLIDEFKDCREWSVEEIVGRLVQAVVGGATELQIKMQGHVQVLRIESKGIKATDFQLMTDEVVNDLVESGRKAVNDLIKHETVRVKTSRTYRVYCHSRDEWYYMIVENSQWPSSTIVVADPHTRWFWKLFPTVQRWISTGAVVVVVVGPLPSDVHQRAREQQRRGLMKRMGIVVHQLETLAVSAFLWKRAYPDSTAIVKCSEDSDYGPYSAVYSGTGDQPVIEALYDTLMAGVDDKLLKHSAALALVDVPTENIVSSLKRGVRQYSDESVTITLGDVELSRIRILTRHARSYKYKQIAYLHTIYENESQRPFAQFGFRLEDGSVTTVTPPVLERHGNNLIAIEGNTRVVFCWRNNIDPITALIVDGVSAPLPGEAIEPSRAIIGTSDLRPEDRIKGFQYQNFRQIERAIRPI